MNVKSVKELNGYTEDYFNFQFEDMELHFITRFSPAFSEFSEDNRLHVKSHFNHMLQFLETGLAQLTSPYLKSTVNHYLNKLTTKIEQKYFMMFLFKNEQSISSSLKKFFIKLINVKNFSIDKLIQQIPHYIIESSEFKTFIDLVGEWNCLNEIAILYIDLINTYYENSFNYKDTLSKYQIKSSNNSVTPIGLEVGNILVDELISNNQAVFMDVEPILYPIAPKVYELRGVVLFLELRLGALAINLLLRQVQKWYLKGTQQHLKLQSYSQQIEKLNLKIRGLVKTCRNLLISLIKAEFSNWDLSEKGLKMAEVNQQQIQMLYKTLNSFFKESSIDKQISMNDLADFMFKNNMIESKDDWLVMLEVPEYLQKNTQN